MAAGGRGEPAASVARVRPLVLTCSGAQVAKPIASFRPLDEQVGGQPSPVHAGDQSSDDAEFESFRQTPVAQAHGRGKAGTTPFFTPSAANRAFALCAGSLPFSRCTVAPSIYVELIPQTRMRVHRAGTSREPHSCCVLAGGWRGPRTSRPCERSSRRPRRPSKRRAR